MKKTYIFALATILTLPAFAATDKTALYGTDVNSLYGAPDNTATNNATKSATKATKTTTKTNKTTAKADAGAKNVTANNNDVASLQEETLAPSENVAAETTNATTPESKSANDFDSNRTYSDSYSETNSATNPKIKFPHGLQLGLGVSATGGLDGFIGYNNKNFDSFWWKRFGVRLGYASTKPFKTTINNKLNDFLGDGKDIGDFVTIHNGNLEAKHMFAVIDFYPFGDTWFLGGMRLSGGYYNGDLKLTSDLTAKHAALANDAEFKLGDTWYKYTAGDKQGLAVANWNIAGPYAGLGFDLGIFRGFKLYMDAGVVFTSESAKLDLQISEASLQQSTDGNTWTALDVPGLNAKKAEALADAQRELDKYTYYPIVKLGFMYRF